MRVEKLDEALAIYAGLMGGQPFSFEGRHFTRQPRPTSCCRTRRSSGRTRRCGWSARGASARTRQPSLERAARWQGWLPQVVDGDWRGNPRSPDELASMLATVRTAREAAGLPWQGFDVCVEGELHGDDPLRRDVAAWQEAGATWWVEGAWGLAAHTGRPGRADPADRRRPTAERHPRGRTSPDRRDVVRGRVDPDLAAG